MAIALEKILNIDLETYLRLNDKKLSDYEVKGVHCVVHYSFRPYDDPIEKTTKEFAKTVPETAEVVVNYQTKTIAPGNSAEKFEKEMTGIALIPKQKKRHNPEIPLEDRAKVLE
ncbi:hypothetical protein HY837_04425 [archaeon]|nr:hypothetical protein [archaeon]